MIDDKDSKKGQKGGIRKEPLVNLLENHELGIYNTILEAKNYKK
jgi:hypothetical protein